MLPVGGRHTYMFYRIKESNGFLSYRLLSFASMCLAAMYGSVLTQGRRLMLPEWYMLSYTDDSQLNVEEVHNVL